MSSKLYNLIMHADPEFWSGTSGYVDFPKDRFLEYTDAVIKPKFQLLDRNAINALKDLPTLFAVEHERADTRIGKVTNVEVQNSNLRIYYKFDKDLYPLTKGFLERNCLKLNIDDRGLEFYRTHWAIKECDIGALYQEYLKSLTGIAHKLKDTDKKVQLIYGFNGMGKTRLSREMKELIAPKADSDDGDGFSQKKFLYYNAFTEDLFYWDNDLEDGDELKLKIQPNLFTDWILRSQGDTDIIKNFQRYTNDKLTPQFVEVDVILESKKTGDKTYPEATFSFKRGDETNSGNIKLSKGEESNFIWSIFYTLLQQVVSILNIADTDARETAQFNQLEYVFIDDPVSSLDENHLIELAVNLADLIRSSKSELKFIITTHNPLFYNVLYSELGAKSGFILNRLEDGTFTLEEKKGDSKAPCTIYCRY